MEAVMLWNEPNNKSHWAFEVDPEWRGFAQMISVAGQAVQAENGQVLRVLGGTSPIDPSYIELLTGHGAMEHLDVVAIHGFPLDWNHWKINEWPQKIASIKAVTDKPVWVTEVGVSTFGADFVQEWGIGRTAELLHGHADRVHWYSLFDLPGAWPASTRHKASEGSSYFRHFHMGLIREDGSPKPALATFREYTPYLGVCQWFHFEDPRLHDAVRWLKKLGVTKLRTGLSWADYYRPGALDWFDRQMAALDGFDLTVTFCFTPREWAMPDIEPFYTAPPTELERFADFCSEMVRRYAPGATVHAPQPKLDTAHHLRPASLSLGQVIAPEPNADEQGLNPHMAEWLRPIF